jgi:hypothetical protein
MDKIKEKLNECSGILKAILLVLAAMTALLTWDSRLVKVSDLQAQDQKQARELQAQEQKTVKNFEQFEQRQERRNLQQREQFLTDRLIMQKQMMSKDPRNPELKEDYVIIKEERDKVREELKTR